MSKKKLLYIMLLTMMLTAGCEKNVQQEITTVTSETEKEETVEPKIINETKKSTTPVLTYTEEDLTIHFEELKQRMEQTTLKEDAINIFDDIKRFIFEEEVLYGYTFAELSAEAKEDIIETSIEMADLITEKFPEEIEIVNDFYKGLKDTVYNTYIDVRDYLDEKAVDQGFEDFGGYASDFKDRVFQKTRDLFNDWTGN